MQTPKRIAAWSAAALVSVFLVVASPARAAAETPRTWENTESYSTMDVLLIFVGIPAALFLAIGLFGWLTHTKKAIDYPIRRESDPGVALGSGSQNSGELTES